MNLPHRVKLVDHGIDAREQERCPVRRLSQPRGLAGEHTLMASPQIVPDCNQPPASMDTAHNHSTQSQHTAHSTRYSTDTSRVTMRPACTLRRTANTTCGAGARMRGTWSTSSPNQAQVQNTNMTSKVSSSQGLPWIEIMALAVGMPERGGWVVVGDGRWAVGVECGGWVVKIMVGMNVGPDFGHRTITTQTQHRHVTRTQHTDTAHRNSTHTQHTDTAHRHSTPPNPHRSARQKKQAAQWKEHMPWHAGSSNMEAAGKNPPKKRRESAQR